MRIRGLEARPILNSVGRPTVEVTVKTDLGSFTSSLPAGTSVSRWAVRPLSVAQTIRVIKRLKGGGGIPTSFNSLQAVLGFERSLEPSRIQSLPLIFAMIKGLAAEQGKQVWQLFSKGKKRRSRPRLLNKLIGGGVHAGGPEWQEFLVCPTGLGLKKELESAYAAHAALGKGLVLRGRDLEGGWVMDVSNLDALDKLAKIATKLRRKRGQELGLGVDVAASTFYKKGSYHYGKRKKLSSKAQIALITSLAERFKLIYVEDPLHQNDFAGFAELKKAGIPVCGDDLLATNPARLATAIRERAVKAAIVKPNQIGYVYKLLEFVKMAKTHGIALAMAHRSQETNDDIIADLAVGLGCTWLKIGLFGGERVAKLNRLLAIC